MGAGDGGTTTAMGLPAARRGPRLVSHATTPWEMFYHRDSLPDEEMQVVWDNMSPINKAYYKRDLNIPKVPIDILDRQ